MHFQHSYGDSLIVVSVDSPSDRVPDFDSRWELINVKPVVIVKFDGLQEQIVLQITHFNVARICHEPVLAHKVLEEGLVEFCVVRGHTFDILQLILCLHRKGILFCVHVADRARAEGQVVESLGSRSALGVQIANKDIEPAIFVKGLRSDVVEEKTGLYEPCNLLRHDHRQK